MTFARRGSAARFPTIHQEDRMPFRARLVSAVAFAMLASACADDSARKQAEEAQKKADEAQKQAAQATAQAQQGAQQVSESAKEMAKGFEALGKSLGALAGDPNQKPVDPVSFRELQTVFPELPGWEKEKPTGEKMTSPFPYSQAEVRYSKGESSIHGKVVDSGFNQLLIAPFQMFLAAGYEKETSSGYEKSTKVGEFPGWEKWNSDGKDGELNAVVGKRFVVTFEGNNINDTKVLYELASKADLAKLAAMK
jgi:hypothetical protein